MTSEVSARTPILSAIAATAVGVAVPWWAMGTNSPVVGKWVQLSLALWTVGLLAGICLIASGGRRRGVGIGLAIGAIAACICFILVYLSAFGLADWD